MILFVLILAGCNSDENQTGKNSSSKPQTASTPVTRPTPDDGARRIMIDELKAEYANKKDDIVFVDTRGADAYKASHIKGAILLTDFQQRAAEFPRDRMIVTYCT